MAISLYEDHVEQIESLDEADKSKLIWILIHYAKDRTAPTEQELAEMHPLMRALWGMMKKDIDNYDKKHEDGKKGGRPKASKTMDEPTQNIPQTIVKPTPNHGLTYPEPTQNIPQTNININRNINTNVVSSKEDTTTIYAREEQNPQTLSSSIPNIYPILNPRESPFVLNPPDVETVFTYGQTNIDSRFTQEQAQAFIDYYDGVGWVSGKNHQPIRQWQKFLKPWIERGNKFAQENQKQEQKHQEGMVMSDAEFDRYLEQKLAQYEEPPRFNADGTYADASRAS